MALRGKKPTTIEKRMKALFFGEAGSGKTTAAIQFPAPYLIDTERGATNDQYVKTLQEKGGAYFFTCDFDEMLQEVMSLLSEKHPYKTVIIDPLTVLYNDLLDKSAKKLATREDPAGTAFGRHKGEADRKVKHLLNLLLRLDMNVIITSHAKMMWGDGMVKLGMTFDCYGKLDYLFDLVFEVQKRGKDNRVGVVKKTRHTGFPEGEVFPFSYDEVANRYGRQVLERGATPEKLATPEQVSELTNLVTLLKIGQEVVDKWLDKADAASFTEMPADSIAKCISYCTNLVKPQEKVSA
jgi:adenosyl cobinamide kinase/adenosyl cobinamide phosphate guanylyltransferase